MVHEPGLLTNQGSSARTPDAGSWRQPKICETLKDPIFKWTLLGRVDFSNLYLALNGQHVASLKEATDRGVPVLA
jgi:hypothetical protein